MWNTLKMCILFYLRQNNGNNRRIYSYHYVRMQVAKNKTKAYRDKVPQLPFWQPKIDYKKCSWKISQNELYVDYKWRYECRRFKHRKDGPAHQVRNLHWIPVEFHGKHLLLYIVFDTFGNLSTGIYKSNLWWNVINWEQEICKHIIDQFLNL